MLNKKYQLIIILLCLVLLVETKVYAHLAWQEYNNEVLTMQYPQDWKYLDFKEDDYLQAEFAKDNEVKLIIEIDKLLEEQSNEEHLNQSRSYIARMKEEAKVDDKLNFVSQRERELDGKKALEVVMEEDITLILLQTIYYQLSSLEESQIEALNKHISRYDGLEDFFTYITSNELEDIKQELLELDVADLSSAQLLSTIRWLIDDIEKLIARDSLDFWVKYKYVITVYENKGITYIYENQFEKYEDKIEIINQMIESVEFK